ncbi:ATP-binding cassette domain-containing protein [Paenalcaligenes niemegkensis]|uniref:ABC transporter ATP-binding protein n=1 Tax=Paenalcaligenes niemegkensis TaxID=2895469 RepID=UPI001EE7F63C|nr:ATP-binding cassette domain-containing protein [Paenalcaligenes niemegkensis]MCQ9616383.1 ATP-binding cassette domain-containing protein [Paenalcaligenes niemegkensis]
MTSHTSTAAILSVEKVSVSYGSLRAVDTVSLEIYPGERHALLGTNGAGKSTLFNAISGSVPVSAGHITYAQQDITHLRMHQRARLGIGRTFQTSLLFADRSVLNNVQVASMGQHGPRFSLRSWKHYPQVSQRTLATLQQFGLDKHLNDIAGSLSYGKQRELEIAMAMISQPALLLLDEPAAGMSPEGRTALLHHLRNLPLRSRCYLLSTIWISRWGYPTALR